MAHIGVVVFPGSNCEYDAAAAMEQLGATTEFIFHSATALGDVDGVILPGGFAHGDAAWTMSRRPQRHRGGGRRAAPEHGVCDGAHERDADEGEDRQQAPVQQVCLERVQEVGHGVTLAIAGAVGELEAPVVEVAGVLAPVGDVGVAPAVRPWAAGST